MIKKHVEVVCAVIEKDNKILCCKRNSKGECGFKWEFPGGKIEPNETKEQALIREIKEELNCDITIDKHITTINHEYNTFNITLHVYKCSILNQDYTLLVHVDSIWCEKDKLKQLDFVQADYKFLDLLIK